MITRIWHGWTTHENANNYQQLLESEILPGIHRIAGYQGATLLRRDAGNEVEFITLTYFDSMDSVRNFAGNDYEAAVVYCPVSTRGLPITRLFSSWIKATHGSFPLFIS